MMPADGDVTVIESAIKQTTAYSTRRVTLAQTRVPSAVKWLGALGAVPFVFLAVTSPFLDGPLQEQMSFALAAYGAVILSFLGGIHWGLAIAGIGPSQTDTANFRRLAFSVTPSLLGWSALLIPRLSGLVLLAVAFALLLVFDSQASRKAQTPVWYSKLRRPLTVVVVASLLLGALA